MSHHTPTSQSRRLALPAELRLRIYDLALPEQVYLSGTSMHPFFYSNPLPSATAYEVRASHECPPPLMFVSKHMYQESRSLLLARLVLNLYGNVGQSIANRFTKLPIFGKVSLHGVQHIKHIEIGWQERSIQDVDIREFMGLKTLRLRVPAYLDADKPALHDACRCCGIGGHPIDLRNFLREFSRRIYAKYRNDAFMNGEYTELASRCEVYLQLPLKNMSIQVDRWCILGAMVRCYRIHLAECYLLTSSQWPAYNFRNDAVEFEITTAVVEHDPTSMFSYPGLLNITDEVVKQIIRGTAKSEIKNIDCLLDILIWKELLENHSERLPECVLDVVRKDGGSCCCLASRYQRR